MSNLGRRAGVFRARRKARAEIVPPPIHRRSFIAGALSAPAALRAQGGLPNLTHFRFTRWRGDPFALGSYSFLARGADPSQRGDLAAPVGPLFFAGEATAQDHPSTVHGALLSGHRAAREILETRHQRVAVIGAGFAGLAAAKDLHAAGRTVTVLEARNRLGGRVHSADLGGDTIDLGASWIHGIEGNPLWDLAQVTGAETRITDWSAFRLYNANGSRRWLPFIPADARHIETTHAFGADPDQLSPDAANEGEEFGGDEVTFAQGYASLLPALLTGYAIEVGKPVRRIDWSMHGGATLSLRGSRRGFDAVLITVPLGVLKAGAIAFAPALPEAKQAAIADLGMGHLSKTFLRFDRPFWDEELHAFAYLGQDPDSFATWINIGQTNGSPTLMAFHGGRAADRLEASTDAAVKDAALKVLRTIFG